MENINLKRFSQFYIILVVIFIAINAFVFHLLFGVDHFFVPIDEAVFTSNTQDAVTVISESISFPDEDVVVETFSRPRDNTWENEWGKFSVVPYRDDFVWSSPGSAESYRIESELWENFLLQTEFLVSDFQNNGSLNFKLRREAGNACGSYNFSFSEIAISITRVLPNCDVAENIYFEAIDLAVDTWHTLTFDVRSDAIRWQLDNDDTHELSNVIYSHGGIGILTYQTGVVYFDNIKIVTSS